MLCSDKKLEGDRYFEHYMYGAPREEDYENEEDIS